MLKREKVIAICLKSVEERISYIQNQMNDLSSGIENEGKSSAGNKHETAVSMMQLEQEKLGEQIRLVMEQKLLLEKLTKLETRTRVCNGSLVKTNFGTYFLGPGLGKINLGNEDFFALSFQSPFGSMLIGKEVGLDFTFNGKKYTILEIE